MANTTSKCSLSVWFEGLWCMELDFISFQGLDLEETPSPVQTARVEEDTSLIPNTHMWLTTIDP